MFAHYFQFKNQFLIDKNFAILELSLYGVTEIITYHSNIAFAVVEIELFLAL